MSSKATLEALGKKAHTIKGNDWEGLKKKWVCEKAQESALLHFLDMKTSKILGGGGEEEQMETCLSQRRPIGREGWESAAGTLEMRW